MDVNEIIEHRVLYVLNLNDSDYLDPINGKVVLFKTPDSASAYQKKHHLEEYTICSRLFYDLDPSETTVVS